MRLLPLISISTTLPVNLQSHIWRVKAVVLEPLNAGPLTFALLIQMSWRFLTTELMHTLSGYSRERLRHSGLSSGVATR